MKVNPKFLALMAALAAGAASAGTTTTIVGTVITNTASASYTNPEDTTKTIKTDSNTVSTTVLPKPNFDVTYNDATPDANLYAGTPASKVTANALPGQEVPTEYAITNTGNADLDVKLAAVVGGDATAANVKYYRYDSTKTGNRGTEITSTDTLTVFAYNALTAGTATDKSLVKFIQVITVPADATPDKAYGASPEGSVVGTGTTLSTTGAVTGNGYAVSTNPVTPYYEESGSDPAKTRGTDLQFAKVTLFKPTVNNNPNAPATPTTPVKPDGTTYAPPAAPNTTPVTVPVSATPVTPGYTDPLGTPIVDLGGDNQSAYPKVDNNDNNPDVVTFTNTLTNSGSQVDKLQLFPGDAVDPVTGALQNGWTFDKATATFTKNAGTPATEIKVQFLIPGTTTPVPVYAGTAGDPIDPAAKFPTLISPAGSTVYYLTKVTYPDPDDSGVTDPVIINIDVDSLKDAGFAPETDGRTTDTIYPAAAQFGDSDADTTTASPSRAPVEKVKPNGIFPTAIAGALTTETDSVAIFPMDVVNNGAYPDTFKLAGSVTFPNATPGGTDVVVKVVYYDSTGNILTNDGITYTTASVAKNSEIKVYAVVQAPNGTPVGDYKVTQTATGVYSTIALKDDPDKDIVRVTADGILGVAKFVKTSGTATETVRRPDLTSGPVSITGPAGYTATGANGAKPGDDITYRIIAKNTYNTAASAFFISDTVPVNTVFQSVSLTTTLPTGAVAIYKVGAAGTWSNVAPVAGEVEGVVIYVAVDNDGATGGYAPSPLPSITATPAGSNELSAEFVVKVK